MEHGLDITLFSRLIKTTHTRRCKLPRTIFPHLTPLTRGPQGSSTAGVTGARRGVTPRVTVLWGSNDRRCATQRVRAAGAGVPRVPGSRVRVCRYPALMTREGLRPGPEASPVPAPHRLLPRPTTSRVKRRISASLTEWNKTVTEQKTVSEIRVLCLSVCRYLVSKNTSAF